MTKVEELKKLESLLESFLGEALKLKGSRLEVVQAINRLDDIARKYVSGSPGHNEIGGWFAHHNEWHNGKELRKTDRNRIGSILNTIRTELDKTDSETAETRKLKTEIDRWVIGSEVKKAKTVVEEPELKPGRKIVLKRPPENQPDDLSDQSIPKFRQILTELPHILDAASQGKGHLISLLDESLDTAEQKKSRQDLLLSAIIIYYLKQDGYLVDPYVKRLRKVERLFKQEATDA